MARPSKYETHMAPRLDEIKQWRSERLALPEIAKRLHVGFSTLTLAKDQHSELAEALELPPLTEEEEKHRRRNQQRNHEKYYESTKSFIRRHAGQGERHYLMEILAQKAENVEELKEFQELIDEALKTHARQKKENENESQSEKLD